VKEQLQQFVKAVKERCDACRDNEAATGNSLILPLFALLGYDVADPRVCHPQHKADFGKGRSVKPVDWAFFLSEPRPAFLVEAKAVGKDICGYDEQLGDYYAKEQPGVTLGILTTGVQWCFFTDRACEHVMDKEPFLTWDILKDDPIPLDFFTILRRAEFKPDLIRAFATGQHRQGLLVAELSRVLEPSSEFVKLAIQNLEELADRRVTAPVIEEWRPILVRALDQWAQQRRLAAALGHSNDKPMADNGCSQDGAPPAPEGKQRAAFHISLKEVLDAGFLKAGRLKAQFHEKDLEAELLASGVVVFQGEQFDNCSRAGKAAKRTVAGRDLETDGWDFWQYQENDGEWVPLKKARQEYMATKAK
jgi:hypothetical protein